MKKKLILFAIVISGYTIFTIQNESMAVSKISSVTGTANPEIDRQHNPGPAYSLLNSRYVSRSTIKRSIDHNNGVRVKILMNGMDNTDIEDFSMEYDSGTTYRMGNIYGIENSSFPLFVKITYRSWNTFHAVQFDVIYEFVIYAPGTWDVTIWN